MREKWEKWVGWSVALVLFVMMLVSDNEIGTVAHFLFMSWIVGCFAYVVARDSSRSSIALLMRAIGLALILAAYAGILEGENRVDDAGDVVSEGYVASLSDKISAAINVFQRLMTGVIPGIFIAKYLNANQNRFFRSKETSDNLFAHRTKLLPTDIQCPDCSALITLAQKKEQQGFLFALCAKRHLS